MPATSRRLIMGKTIVFWALCLALTASAVAQHQHEGMSPTETIDGSKNPELVPDLTAYRLYFLAATSPANAPAEEAGRRWNHIRALGLNFSDSQAIGSALADFRS